MKISRNEFGAISCSSGGSWSLSLRNVSASKALSMNLLRWYGLDFSPITATLNSKARLLTQNAVLYRSSSRIGMMKNALDMSIETTTLFLSLKMISSAVVNDVCCGNSRQVFSSLKSRQIRYSADRFCSPVC